MHRACPVCGGDDSRLLLTRGPWRLVECAACHLAYLPDIPTGERVETEFEWNASFARERWERWQRNPFTRIYTYTLMLLKPSRERRAVRRIRRTVRGGRLLDIACGDGRFAAVALRAGFDPMVPSCRRRWPRRRAGGWAMNACSSAASKIFRSHRARSM
jgi:hypothetical protein